MSKDDASRDATNEKQTWTEAVLTCVSDSAERERLIRMYDYDELVQACLTLGTLALTAKTEYQRAEKLQGELTALRSETRTPAIHPAARIALRVLLNHIEPGDWENCKAVVEQWLADPACFEKRE